MKEPKNKPLWSSQTKRIILTSAICFTIFAVGDNITVHNFITSPDSLTAAFTYLILGSWVGLSSSLVFAVLVGQRIADKRFTKLRLGKELFNKHAIIAGSAAAISTLFLLLGNQLGDPSMLIALSNATILYIVIYETLRKKEPTNIWTPAILVVGGSMIAAYSGSLQITIFGALLVLLVSNILRASAEVREKMGMEETGEKTVDGVNFFVWRFLWLALTATILAILVSALRGTLGILVETLVQSLKYIPWIILVMFFVFLGISLKLVAKSRESVSFVMLLSSVQIVLGFPLTLLGNLIVPGVFGQIPTDITVWVVRIIGAGLMIWGISKLLEIRPQT